MMTTKISLLLKSCYFNGTIVLDTKIVLVCRQCFALNLSLLISFSLLVDVNYYNVKSIISQKHIDDLQKKKISSVDITADGSLKDGHLSPGAAVSVDHFESRLKGRTYDSFGKTSSDQYVGGCIFVDHMSGYIHVEPQLGFSTSESIRAVITFEKLCLDNGTLIQKFLADNGAFKAKDFVNHIRNNNQRIQYCGVNAHHQNGIAERNIRTVSDMSRAMMLHASLKWKNGIDSSLWPMAVNYATYVFNHLPSHNGLAPVDLFTGSQLPRHRLLDIHTWRCPIYVLDPTLQSGKKLPRWQPRSRRGFSLDLVTSIPVMYLLS